MDAFEGRPWRWVGEERGGGAPFEHAASGAAHGRSGRCEPGRREPCRRGVDRREVDRRGSDRRDPRGDVPVAGGAVGCGWLRS
ncbi:hypothetical protein Pla163_15090 [Planctomycetes bacterium Pla163]|uniref:Uncharacterized protein n=1 Tax=Rohdeia mirabilis TaxID=2528008 RepID=A0A518CYY1_9BACT|nr:hypothetical protein Pla163_15090 [Planctomycetes bacterium Pla163]